MKQNERSTAPLSMAVEPISSHIIHARIVVSPTITEAIRTQTHTIYKEHIIAQGLDIVPMSYVQNYYKEKIEHDVQKLILQHAVISFLYQECSEHKIPLAGFPRLKKIEALSNGSIAYLFDLSSAHRLEIREWKHFLFRAPRRKNYKDLDKQVETFLKQSQEKTRKEATGDIQQNDWVFFHTQLTDKKGALLPPKTWKQGFWVKIKVDTIAHPLFTQLLGKKTGDAFITNELFLDGLHETSIGDQHYFSLTIDTIAKGDFFLLDLFKSNFKLNNKTEVHEKLIEVFSYRNDISQRRAIIEEMFHLLFSKHRFEVPKHLILRKQEEILDTIKKRPDYHAYRSAPDFLEHIAMLAEKLLKEEIIIDQIAEKEGIVVEMKDQQQYLNLLGNHRLKEFIYFRSVIDTDEPPAPIHETEIIQVTRREKTLNYVLYHLMH